MPVDDFFRDKKIVDFSRSIIFSNSFKDHKYYEIVKLFEMHVIGKKNIGDLIWKWINLELWLRLYFDNKDKIDSYVIE